MSTHLVSLGSYEAFALQPNMPRAGLIGGFAISPANLSFIMTPNSPELWEQVTGLAVNVSAGIAVVGPGGHQFLCVYQPEGYTLPAAAPFGAGNFAPFTTGYPTLASASAPNAPANALSWLWLTVNTSTGIFSYYWNSSGTAPANAGDTLIGWVVTNATAIVGWSVNVVWAASMGEGSAAQTLLAAPPPAAGAPGSTAYGDTGTPTGTNFNLFIGWNGLVQIAGLEFTTNYASVLTAIFDIYYFAFGAAAVDTGLTANVTASGTSFPVPNGTLYKVGTFYAVDLEVVLVTATASATITVTRGALNSTATAHYASKAITGTSGAVSDVVTCAGHGRSGGWPIAISGVVGDTAVNGSFLAGTVGTNTIQLSGTAGIQGVPGNGAYASGGTLAASQLFPLTMQAATASLTPQFFTSVAAPNWVLNVALPNAWVYAVVGWGVNAYGGSPQLQFPQPMSATFQGTQVTMQVNGTLGIASAACQPVQMPGFVTGCYSIAAFVQTAPSGAAIVAQISVNGVFWATVEIANGSTFSVLTVGNTLSIPAGATVSLAITAVGTTFPGAGLTVVIQQ